jgi:hypothetical protein
MYHAIVLMNVLSSVDFYWMLLYERYSIFLQRQLSLLLTPARMISLKRYWSAVEPAPTDLLLFRKLDGLLAVGSPASDAHGSSFWERCMDE